MKIIDIEKSSIACIQHKYPLNINSISKIKPSYEWFYFDITHENDHIVLILSMQDSFSVEKNNQKPASVYLTWHKDKKLCAYSYSLYTGENLISLHATISDFLNKKSEYLELFLPDFSEKKYIHLNLSSSLILNSENENTELNFNQSTKKHYWQFISNGPHINGFIETINISKSHFATQKKYFFSRSKFCDEVLNKKLTHTSCFRTNFSNSQVYFDHNFGFLPLYTMKESWYWWHTETQNNSHENNNWEVVYFFPHINKAYYSSNKKNETEIINLSEKSFVIEKRTSPFFVPSPTKINFSLNPKIHFNKIIESAPFYLRSITQNKYENKFSSTLEVLIPKRISQPINQVLMSARQLKIRKIVTSKKQLESSFSFFELIKNITKGNGKSFFFASLILSKVEQKKCYLIYTLCRLIDDATDEIQNTNSNSENGTEFSNIIIDILWGDKAVTDEFITHVQNKLSSSLFSCVNKESAINFIQIAKQEILNMKLLKSHFSDLIAGQLMDENFTQPVNFNDFYLYCYRVAGVVGLMMTKIFRVSKNPFAEVAAEHLGIAMQITNILRDVKEDFNRDRIYIPKSNMKKYGFEINTSAFTNPQLNETEKIKLIDDFTNQAIFYYSNAINGISYITKRRFRFCVRLMSALYGGILGKIMQNKMIPFQCRAIVTPGEKVIIFIKVLLGFHPLHAAGIPNYKNYQGKIDEKI